MKFKKSIVVLSTVFTLAIGSHSAFAKVGYGDYQSLSIPLTNGVSNYTIIEHNADSDWYVWTNNTGKILNNWEVTLQSPYTRNYDMEIELIADQFGEERFTAADNGTSAIDAAGGSPVYPGEKIFVRVYSHAWYDFDPVRNYTLTLTAN